MTTSTSQTASSTTSVRDAAAAAIESDSCELPVLPEVAVQLLKLTADVDCDPKDIVELFKRDQSLTGHLLKAANSVRYNCGQTVTSIQQSVARLGLNQVREIVMMISCQTTIFNVDEFDADVRLSFQKSLTTAAFSQEIARKRRLNVEEAFLCGILHDVGRPILLQVLSDLRKSSEIEATDDELRLTADEFRIPMAARLVRSWELPERVAEIIEHQRTPLEAGANEVPAAMLSMSADMADYAFAGQLDADGYTHPLADVLTLYPEDVQTLVEKSDDIIDWVRSTV